jgi:hypothetical protein
MVRFLAIFVTSAFSVVIDHCHIKGAAVVPAKHDPPLVIDSYRVHSFQPTFERLKPVAWRHPEITKLRGIVQVQQLATRDTPKLRLKPPGLPGLPVEEQILRQSIPEVLEHIPMLSNYDNPTYSAGPKSSTH